MKSACQAVVVRYVHDVLTDEFLNVGVVLLCPEKYYVRARFISQWSRVTAAFPNADLAHLRRTAARIVSRIDEVRTQAQDRNRSLPLLFEPDIEKFMASVLPPDDSSIQLSPGIRGVTDDPDRTLAELHHRYALRHLPEEPDRVARTDQDVWQTFVTKMAGKIELFDMFRPVSLRAPKSPNFQFDFPMAWKNGIWNIAQPVSFDLLDVRNISEKATLWMGRVYALRPSEQNAQIMFLIGMPPKEVPQPLHEAAAVGVELLTDNLAGEARIITEDRSDDLAAKIEHDLTHTS